jgi:hypothetical protein
MQYGHQAWSSRAAGKEAGNNDDGISADKIPISHGAYFIAKDR